MSGIYIPGMEMPKSCFQCEFRTKIDPDNLMCIISQKTFEDRFYHIEHRDSSCPLVPVPKHDGPLVDALDIINAFPDEFIFTNEQARALTNYIIPADPADKEVEGWF